MARITIGPSFTEHLECVSEYIRHLLGLSQCAAYRYNEQNETFVLTLYPGTWSVEGIVFHYKRVSVDFFEGKYYEQIEGYLEGPSIKAIRDFVKRAIDYSETFDLLGKPGDENRVKILTWDYSWEYYTSIKKRSLESLKLPKKTIQMFIDDLERFMKPETIQWYDKFNVSHSRIYLLHGPPGTGKTSLIQFAASYLDRSISRLDISQRTRDCDLRRALENLSKKTIFVIEDIDCLFKEREADDTNMLTFSGFLNIFDGVTRLKDDVLVFITTNHLETLDGALKRRVDYFVEFDYCTKQQIKDMVRYFNPEESDESLEDFVNNTCNGLKLTPCALQKFLIQRKPRTPSRVVQSH